MVIATDGRQFPLRLLLLMTLLLLVTSCGVSEQGEGREALCGVVVDSTSYSRYPVAKDLVSRELPGFLAECRSASFAAVTGSSESTDCRSRAIDLAPRRAENPNDNPKVAEILTKERTNSALFAATKLLSCPLDKPGSDVLGALKYLQRQLRAALDDPEREKIRVAMFSDLIQNDDNLNMHKEDYSTQEARDGQVRALKDKGLLPDLTGFEVSVYGFALSDIGSDATQQSHLMALWVEIFQAAGANKATIL